MGTLGETMQSVVLQADTAMGAVLRNQDLRSICTHEQLSTFREAERELYALRMQLSPPAEAYE